MKSGASIIAESIERAVDYKLARSKPRTKTVTGIYVGKDGEGKAWVRLSGANGAIPIRRMSVQADVGDTVSVTVGGGRAVMDSNVSNPSASSTVVAGVNRRAVVAQQTAVKAVDYAVEASAASAAARASANGAQISAEKAHVAADNAEADAVRAHAAADDAMAEAVRAHDAADSAQESAVMAQNSAEEALGEAARANRAANDAMVQLGNVEDVVDTLGWFATHTKQTTDVTVDPNKTYYTFDGESYSKVEEPVDDDIAGYYELDATIQNYVASHLALTDNGLFLVMDGSDMRLKLDSAGVYVTDGDGHEVASFTNEGIHFDSTLPQTVGSDNAYVKYYDSDDDGEADAISINANSISIAGSDVSTVLDDIDGRLSTVVEGLQQSSYFTQTADGFQFSIDTAISDAMQAADDARKVATDYLSFDSGELTIGSSESNIKSVLTNKKFAFTADGDEMAYFGLNSSDVWEMHIANTFVDDQLRFGNFAWISRDNGNMSLKWLGD